jgi:hypothetical protein
MRAIQGAWRSYEIQATRLWATTPLEVETSSRVLKNYLITQLKRHTTPEK